MQRVVVLCQQTLYAHGLCPRQPRVLRLEAALRVETPHAHPQLFEERKNALLTPVVLWRSLRCGARGRCRVGAACGSRDS